VQLIDSHCHLSDAAFDSDRGVVLSRAREAGVEAIVVVADTVASARAALALANAHPALSDVAPQLVATAGIHPHHAGTCDDAAARELERLWADPRVVAIGETGLDFHYDRSPRDRQREVFSWQLGAAARCGKPVIIHSRDADEDTARLLATAPSGLAGVLHSFSAGQDVLDAALARGFFVSWSGMITFRNWNQAKALALVPDDRLLVETDAPYLAPVPHRGKRNEPAFVAATAARLAELRGVAVERVAEWTSANARRLFKVGSIGGPRPAAGLPS
jgi:TatD DNase family protein